MIFDGKTWKLGDNVDTDAIIPARYLYTSDVDALAEHCLEDLRPEFAEDARQGDIIVAGRNFGCGSSREHAPLVLKAKAAAKNSYAPYTQNLAGCVIMTVDGKKYTGRYAENAAFNPSLTALHTALINMTMALPGLETSIHRAVLVERSTSISQRAACELLLQTVASNVSLEYFEAV